MMMCRDKTQHQPHRPQSRVFLMLSPFLPSISHLCTSFLSLQNTVTSPMASIPPAHQTGKTALIIEPTSQIGRPGLQECRAAQPEAASAPNTFWQLLLPYFPLGLSLDSPQTPRSPLPLGGPAGAVHGDHPRAKWRRESSGYQRSPRKVRQSPAPPAH